MTDRRKKALEALRNFFKSSPAALPAPRTMEADRLADIEKLENETGMTVENALRHIALQKRSALTQPQPPSPTAAPTERGEG
jgi:hypothetical protein